MSDDLKRKLTSRKFWAAITAFVTSILVAFNVDAMSIEQIIAIITAVGSLVCYIFAESYIDGKNASSTTSSQNYEYHEVIDGSIVENETLEEGDNE